MIHLRKLLAGIGLVIVVDQVPKLLGIHIDKAGFLRDVLAIVQQLPATSLATLLLANPAPVTPVPAPANTVACSAARTVGMPTATLVVASRSGLAAVSPRASGRLKNICWNAAQRSLADL